MKVVTVPADITVKGVQKEETIPFKDFLVHHLDNFEGIKTPSQVRQAGKIVGTIEAANGTIALEDAEYEILKSALQSIKYFPKVARQLVAYWDAFDKAEEVKK